MRVSIDSMKIFECIFCIDPVDHFFTLDFVDFCNITFCKDDNIHVKYI